MKKIISIVLSLMLIVVFSMTPVACKKKEEPQQPAEQTAPSGPEKSKESGMPSDTTTEKPMGEGSTGSPGGSTSTQPGTSGSMPSQPATGSETSGTK